MTFGYWTVLDNSSEKWLCQCRCGTQRRIVGRTVKDGRSKSCGCYRRARNFERWRERGHIALTKAGRAERAKQWQSRNRKQLAEYMKQWRQENWEDQADHTMRYLYGLPRGTYAKMLAAQGGKCAICGTNKPNKNGKRYGVDHCHKTHRVRGILCQNCNFLIGLAKDDISILQAAIRYLQERGTL